MCAFAMQAEEEEEDPFETRLKETGCAEMHYALQDCMDRTKDWRQCQPQVCLVQAVLRFW